MPKKFDELDAFFRWWHANNLYDPPTMGEIMQHNNRSISTVVYRDAKFQVQQVIMLPNSEITDHRHPSVDSFVVYGAGDLTFRANDQVMVGVTPGLDRLRIRETDWHGGTFGPRGAVFFTIQHWLNGDPKFVIDDWIQRDPTETRKNHELYTAVSTEQS